MNVNLTPPVEPSKIAPTAKSSAVSTDAAAMESSGGFFAQLHALIFGSKTASDAPATNVTQNEGDTEAPVNTEAALEADSDAALMAEMDDALFSASEVEAASEEGLPVDVIKSAQKAPSLEKGEAISTKVAPVKQDEQGANAPIPASLAKWVTNAESIDDQPVSGELQRKTAQAMSEGDELLGRLQEANQALIKTNGKTLPAQHGQALDSQHPDGIRNATPPEAVLPIESATAISNRALSTSADLDAAVSDSAATEDEIAQDEWMASALMGGALAGGLSGASLAAANTVHAEPVEGAMLEGVPLTQTLANTAALASPSSEVSEALAASSQALKATPLTQSALNPASIMADEGLNLPTSATEMGKVAIPWGTPMPTDNELAALTPELKAMLEGGKAKAPVPNALAQSVAQGLTPAHLAAQQTGTAALPMNPTAATPIDMAALAPQTVAANPMLNPAATVNPELAASSAMLAALGGRALAGSDERRAVSESGQEGLAQQIAAAAGQGTAQNQALNRVESQLVQTNATPVPLNKEMAADQLAERVQMMMSKNLKNIDIRLDPPELGRMHIRMNMQGDGATVHFTVANQHAREALEQTMPRLREMLAQQGVQLGDTSVQQQSAGQQQRYTGQEQSGFGQSARNERLNSEENLDTDIKLDLNVATKRDGISYYA
ncbi:flagellar hook-length control protein FliK [Vibrio cholerae]|uniref:flagellar hook-length control protein FliK n=1 Tax=Vibrio TaxID=662 RepID=UPI0002735281|nr:MULTISPECIES: flagellar hook-length control protein FliK [Vibrio]EJH50883.1 flagellar hook-length control family protein [Vibrio cholerae HC-43B1]EKF9129804.1 flagellar hook-length control protein FliK [Vibrio cholerae]EKF9428066.1 flagellar hook-length control protein FliK [Vibrio cholerae]EKF9786245.1 flagellar hook-length control protein FliK [Vibrio cholerae]EKL02190.1 flagellar hook-length control FliK family protein [Vibrio cholerae HC-41B1]